MLWVGWKFSDLGREVAWSGFSSLLKCPLLVFLEVKSQSAMASSLLFWGVGEGPLDVTFLKVDLPSTSNPEEKTTTWSLGEE